MKSDRGEGEGDAGGREKYPGTSGCSYETKGLMMAVMLSFQKLGEKGKEKLLGKVIVSSKLFPLLFLPGSN